MYIQVRDNWAHHQSHVEHYWLETLDHLRRIKVNKLLH